jgi:CubicO group peptidase (beta-lactamase class C family)
VKTTRFSLAAAALVVACAPAVPSGTTAPTPEPTAELSRMVDSLANAFITDWERGSPGVSIEVVSGSGALVMKGWGMADLENDVPATAQTVYRIGSITKQFTAAAVMQLVHDARVKLDEPIGTYLPTLPSSWRAATVRECLNYTSGVPSYTDAGQRWIGRWGEEMPPTPSSLSRRTTPFGSSPARAGVTTTAATWCSGC